MALFFLAVFSANNAIAGDPATPALARASLSDALRNLRTGSFSVDVKGCDLTITHNIDIPCREDGIGMTQKVTTLDLTEVSDRPHARPALLVPGSVIVQFDWGGGLADKLGGPPPQLVEGLRPEGQTLQYSQADRRRREDAGVRSYVLTTMCGGAKFLTLPRSHDMQLAIDRSAAIEIIPLLEDYKRQTCPVRGDAK